MCATCAARRSLIRAQKCRLREPQAHRLFYGFNFLTIRESGPRSDLALTRLTGALPGQDRARGGPPNIHLDFRQQQSGQGQECAR
jgi:hypothetical protein